MQTILVIASKLCIGGAEKVAADIGFYAGPDAGNSESAFGCRVIALPVQLGWSGAVDYLIKHRT